MSDTTHSDHHTADSAPSDVTGLSQLNWKWTLAMGVLFLIGGFVAFLNPFIASLAVEGIIAAFFLIGGVMQGWMAFKNQDGTTGSRVAGGLLGLLMILFAVSLWLNPILGLLSLTILMASFFLALGLVRIWVSFRMRERKGWGWMAASGAVSVLLAILIFASLPVSALGLLGLFFGIELVGAGIAAIMVALEARKSG